MKKAKSKSVKIIIGVVCVIITSAAYFAADRYLIEHVEIDNVSNLTSISDMNTPTVSSVVSKLEKVTDAGNTNDLTSSKVIGDNSDTARQVILDDWNYSKEDVSISVKEVSIGSGNSKVTYFVADIKLSDATKLESAFAKNKFGRNIVQNTSVIAKDNNAIFAINGDYYGFRNDGIEIRNGVIFRDEPARTGLAFYKDGSMEIYDETTTNAQELLDKGVWNTLSFGPALLVNSEVPSDISESEVDTNFGNHSIQGSHPRTGIGIVDNNHFVVVVVDGRDKGYSKGLSLPDFAQILKDNGCTAAYNLDGGGSSTMYFNDRVVNNPQGKNKERGVSDILFIAG